MSKLRRDSAEILFGMLVFLNGLEKRNFHFGMLENWTPGMLQVIFSTSYFSLDETLTILIATKLYITLTFEYWKN